MTVDVGTPTAVEAGPPRPPPNGFSPRRWPRPRASAAVAIDSNFFDELGLDSLTIAHFCARVRKGAKVPSISVRDCYQHPTIRSLAASLPEFDPVQPDVVAAPPRSRGSTRCEHASVRGLRSAAAPGVPRLCVRRRGRVQRRLRLDRGRLRRGRRVPPRGRGRRRELRRHVCPSDRREVDADRALETRGDPDLERALLPLLARPHADPGEPDAPVRRLAALPALPQGAGREDRPGRA